MKKYLLCLIIPVLLTACAAPVQVALPHPEQSTPVSMAVSQEDASVPLDPPSSDTGVSEQEQPVVSKTVSAVTIPDEPEWAPAFLNPYGDIPLQTDESGWIKVPFPEAYKKENFMAASIFDCIWLDDARALVMIAPERFSSSGAGSVYYVDLNKKLARCLIEGFETKESTFPYYRYSSWVSSPYVDASNGFKISGIILAEDQISFSLLSTNGGKHNKKTILRTYSWKDAALLQERLYGDDRVRWSSPLGDYIIDPLSMSSEGCTPELRNLTDPENTVRPLEGAGPESRYWFPQFSPSGKYLTLLNANASNLGKRIRDYYQGDELALPPEWNDYRLPDAWAGLALVYDCFNTQGDYLFSISGTSNKQPEWQSYIALDPVRTKEVICLDGVYYDTSGHVFEGDRQNLFEKRADSEGLYYDLWLRTADGAERMVKRNIGPVEDAYLHQETPYLREYFFNPSYTACIWEEFPTGYSGDKRQTALFGITDWR